MNEDLDRENLETPEVSELPEANPRRSIYLLPNLFTTGALFFGFYAIVAAGSGAYENAAIAIFVALVLDGLDGRVARLTNTQSAFGAQYDSLSDVVCFGVAPALVAHSWSLSQLGKLGWIAAFFYTAATALRLARFNTQLEVADKRYFQGLPCPSAAALVASVIWVSHLYQLEGLWIARIMAFVCVLAGLLMVSNVRYYSFKEFDLKHKVPFMTVLAALLVFICISMDPPLVLCSFFLLYTLSGLLISPWFKSKNKPKI
jgi:CDP-diacylglycerol--serine O-phosphatidyltransferase